MPAKTPNPVDITVGHNVRLYRLAAKLSQEGLGEKIGVTFQQVQKYEKGTNRVGASRLTMIANVLNVPIARLFDGVASAPARKGGGRALTELIAEPHALRLAQAFAEIADTDMRRTIVQLVENIVTRDRPTR